MTDVTLFVRGNDGKFTRYDEQHIQYVHERDEVISALEKAGFEILSVEGHLGQAEKGSDRINFICKKVKS